MVPHLLPTSCVAGLILGAQKLSQSGDTAFSMTHSLENKHQSLIPVRVTPGSSQGIHLSRAGKPGIEGLSLTRVYLLLCTVWGAGRDRGWEGGEGEGGS